MITAREAREIKMSNPTFDRKVELYNTVSTKINEAAMNGKDSFSVTDEEYFALKNELKEKGYTEMPFLVGLIGNNRIYKF